MRYVIYVPDDTRQEGALAECLNYAENTHPEWHSAGVVTGRWPDVIAMTRAGLADVILIAERAHLPPDRVPRVVSVEEEMSAHPGGCPTRPTQRRPHPLL